MIDPLLLPLAQAAAACYDDGIPPTFQNEDHLCHVYLSTVGGVPTFAFEGTIDWQEWIVDCVAAPVPFTEHDLGGPVHEAYLLNVMSVLPRILKALENLGRQPFYVTGHSKGAGEAIICHMLLKSIGHTPLATRAFEPPRVGGRVLTEYLAGDDVGWTQTWNDKGPDLVTMVPNGLITLLPPTLWEHQGVLTRLRVPDCDDLATKHKIPAVIAALEEPTTVVSDVVVAGA